MNSPKIYLKWVEWFQLLRQGFFVNTAIIYTFNVHVWMFILIEYLRQVFDVYAECSVTDRCDRALALAPLWN